jgi:hypothetical protein
MSLVSESRAGRTSRMPTYYKVERACEECGERFWSTGARVCSVACRSRQWRKQKAMERSATLANICKEIMMRRASGSASYSKLLPRLFRATAAELRKRGWDPIELLMSMPEDPATTSDTAPGGIENDGSQRRKWLHPPEEELKLLDETIAEREEQGFSTTWHRARAEKLRELLATRSPKRKAPVRAVGRASKR